MYLKWKKKGKSHRSVIDRNRSDVYEIEKDNAMEVTLPIVLESNDKTRIKKEMIGLLVEKMNSI